MSTVAALIAEAKELAGAGVAWSDRVSPILERRFYDTVLDECVRLYGLLFRRYTCDIVDGTAAYCTPPLDTIEAVYILSSTDEKKQIGVLHSNDGRGGTVYTDPSDGEPTLALFEGLGTIRLHPTPDYDKTAGLELQGYGPYNPSDYSLTSECPLNGQDEIAVIRGIAYYLLEFIGDPRQATMRTLYDKARAQIEVNAHTYTASHRMRGVTPNRSYQTGLNPLNT